MPDEEEATARGPSSKKDGRTDVENEAKARTPLRHHAVTSRKWQGVPLERHFAERLRPLFKLAEQPVVARLMRPLLWLLWWKTRQNMPRATPTEPLLQRVPLPRQLLPLDGAFRQLPRGLLALQTGART